MWHKIASAALGIASFCAAKFIPAAVVLTLGPISVPVAAAVSAGLAIAAAVGVEPTKVSPSIANLLDKVTVGKVGQKAPSDSIGQP